MVPVPQCMPMSKFIQLRTLNVHNFLCIAYNSMKLKNMEINVPGQTSSEMVKQNQ